MNRKEAEEYVKSRYADYLRPAKKKGTYICPNCGNGTGADGDGICLYPGSKNPYTLRCFKCNTTGSIVDFYQKEHNCTIGEAFRGLYDFFGLTIDNERDNLPAEARKEPQRITTSLKAENPAEGNITPHEGKADFRAYYEACRANISDPAAQKYLESRGISADMVTRFMLGYDKNERRIIIPASNSFYVARAIDPAAKLRYKNPAGVSAELFNKECLQNESGRPVFITEGAIDALSIIEAGGEAVALNSTSNAHKLVAELTKQRTNNMLIICQDNDDAGARATTELIDGFKKQNIPYITANICGRYKDPNEAFTSDREAFIEDIRTAERRTNKPDNTIDYIKHGMAAEIDKLKAQSDRKTGFSNLDAEAGSIYAGLYVVGGISSVGKTTFAHQLCDQMAAQGQHVLFFSMEQSRLEMVSKSIARQTAAADPEHAVSSLQVRTGVTNEYVKRAIDEYTASVEDRLSIIEGNFNCTVSFISNYTRLYMERNNGVRPVVVVDYLQVLQADKDPDTGRKSNDIKQIVDHNITELKRMSRALEIPVFVISSINRSNYLTPIDFEAFKESGGIEFTADVVWGLQLAVIHDDIFNKKDKLKEKREKVAAAKEAIPRDIELVCLKNRYGKSRYAAQFTYYPQYDYFEPVVEPAFTTAYHAPAWSDRL